jgi:anaerobic selenocysteine-containing dehydrogenase
MSSTKNKIVLKKLKELDTIWHPESKLVFKSSKDKVVIGRYENDELISLDDECLELCAKWKFKYDKDLVQEEEDDENEEEHDEEDDYEKVSETVNENLDSKDEHKKNDAINENIDYNTKDEHEYEHKNYQEDDNEKNEHTQNTNEIVNTNEFISNITNEYTKRIHDFFDYLSQKYNDELLNLKNEIIQKNKLYDELLNNYNKEVTEHSNKTEELNKLKTKFDGIKQLFSI